MVCIPNLALAQTPISVPYTNEAFDSAKYYQITQTYDETYSNYLVEKTDKSVELTRQYQDEIGLWNQGIYDDSNMAKITDSFLPRFINQINEFNGTKAPEEYSIVKENFVKSFASEIKSYELFRDYLITNNSTKNDLSTEYLSDALTFETIARNAFVDVKDNSSSNNHPLNDKNVTPNMLNNTNSSDSNESVPQLPAGIVDQV